MINTKQNINITIQVPLVISIISSVLLIYTAFIMFIIQQLLVVGKGEWSIEKSITFNPRLIFDALLVYYFIFTQRNNMKELAS